MSLATPTFTLGIEEEYLLVDRATRDLVSEPPQSMIEGCDERTSVGGSTRGSS